MILNKEAVPLVTVRCITYNQVNFIRDCLEGFVSQKTSFPFEVVIHDDASTDGTKEVIEEYASKYPEIIKPLYEKENQWSKHNGIIAKLLQDNSKGKYIAYCEGDDYWTNCLHLESMVSFLEQHDEVGMCYSQCRYYYEKERKFDKRPWGGRGESFEELIKENCIPTLSVVYRRNLDQKYLEYRDNCQGSSLWTMGDYPRWLWFSANSKVCFFNTVDGIYRVLPESASHSTDISKRVKFIQSYCTIRSKFCDDFANKKQKSRLKNLVNNQCNWNLLTVYVKNGLMVEARLCHKKIVIYNIKSLAQYLLGYLMINISFLKIIKT